MKCASLVAAAALCALAGSAQATLITFSASAGNLAASATFDTSGTNLVVTLTNTSAFDVLVPADILTSVFFDISGSALSLGRVSGVLGAGSSVVFPPSGTGTDPVPVGGVGGEWAYVAPIAGPYGAYGIGSAGLGIFGDANMFPGSNLQGPIHPDGMQYGITSAGDSPFTGNAAVTGANALILNEVVFTLSGLPVGFDPSASIFNVVFQYGTALDEPHIPAPGALALLPLGALAAFRRRR